MAGIPYDNAKAINRTYLKERRVNKINYRLRYQRKKSRVLNGNLLSNEESKHFETHENSMVGPSFSTNLNQMTSGSKNELGAKLLMTPISEQKNSFNF
jgi:hypothetical protein